MRFQSIHIPVTIRVTDVNDNAPKFIGGPFHINISEQTLPGSTILNGIKATDLDQQGPYSTLTFSAINSRDGKPSVRTKDIAPFPHLQPTFLLHGWI